MGTSLTASLKAGAFLKVNVPAKERMYPRSIQVLAISTSPEKQ